MTYEEEQYYAKRNRIRITQALKQAQREDAPTEDLQYLLYVAREVVKRYDTRRGPE
jgi:hypothetical protein